MPTVIWSIPMFPSCVSVLRCTLSPCGSRMVDATSLNMPEPSPSHMDTSSSSTSSWPGYRGRGCWLACSPRAHVTSRMGEHPAQQSSPISKFARRRYVRSSSPALSLSALFSPFSLAFLGVFLALDGTGPQGIMEIYPFSGCLCVFVVI